MIYEVMKSHLTCVQDKKIRNGYITLVTSVIIKNVKIVFPTI